MIQSFNRLPGGQQSTSNDAVHRRVAAERGKAREHQCAVDGCTRQASDWAWLHSGPQRTGLVARVPRTWGTDTSNYTPLCRHHHMLLDAQHRRSA